MAHVELAEGAVLLEKSFITDEGTNNRIILHENARFGTIGSPRIEFKGSNNTLEVFESCTIKRGHYRFVGDGNRISFGKKTTLNGAYFLCDGGSLISTGEDCMFSYEIELRTTDAHTLFDTQTGELLNPPEDIIIGDHCWIGKGACILQGVVLPNDTVVGTRALVTKSFDEPFTAIAGIPAKVVRRNVGWRRPPPTR